MGRLEAFALGNKPVPSIFDGLGNGIGYGLVLIVVAFFKELFGSGTLTIPGFEKFQITEWIGIGGEGSWYSHNGLMLLPPSSLIIVAIYIWIQKSRNPELVEK